MKTRWSRIPSMLAATAMVLAISGYAFFQQPLFGQHPEGDRLSLAERSANYRNGTFHNQIDSPLHTSGSSELSILLDPVFSENAAPIPMANRAFAGTSIYSAEDMPDIDVLLITHDHYDHLDYPSIIALQPKVRQVVAGLGVGTHFEAWGYPADRISEVDWYDTVSLDGLNIHATPARHFSGRTFDRNRSLWVGYALTTDSSRIFFSGDSGYAQHFAEVGNRYGPFDWATLDAGQYDPRWANVHMTPEQAAQAAEDLGTAAFTPGHVGRFSIAPHDWNDPFIRITAASQGRSYALWTPIIGSPIHLDGREQAFAPWWETTN
ncbi:MAG TPA: MBL fold metallo-hydrolase [Pseudomonas sp.]|uniref:MBL fold metallo-hydrolase n=1 Tax=Pseudomonas sp. TaxID=306 RepID=UPI002C706EF4|nr:MBL fold metallo-hydrolase [Pseudomonas sp.]HSX89936.1 MBL fold metallo-hydrolase [Pseudomonas sp.]